MATNGKDLDQDAPEERVPLRFRDLKPGDFFAFHEGTGAKGIRTAGRHWVRLADGATMHGDSSAGWDDYLVVRLDVTVRVVE